MARRRRPPRAGALGEVPPARIAAQIAVLQLLYYAVALVLMLFTTLIAGSSFSIDLVLGWDCVRGDTTNGWLIALVWVLTGGFGMALAIVALIARSKLVPDFALTIHFLHLVVTSLYTHMFPRNAMWWLTMLVSASIAVSLGIWGCQYRELQPVFFGGGRILGAGSGTGGAAGASAAPPSIRDDGSLDENVLVDEEMGYSRGRGRGRGRDGAGEYEMAKMEPSP
ncbi:integral membrane protein [Stachybotrys elegans]|uniref:Integral membrane protein n=1 Tax=Stachybotrys elegans TaxID=80388 RepID=A0A8K0WSU8_9HYPO|nr:integral membrane protein [Stachybotrys elegans]